MSDAVPSGDDRRPRWYGRRHGHRLRKGRQDLVTGLLPKLRIVPPSDGGRLDLFGLFADPVAEIWLEVGFGAGEHLAAQARANPNVGLIGCEPFVNGVASLLARIRDDDLTNIRIFDDDARLLFDALPDAGFNRAFTLFSDPWPKKRHHRRRFISPQTLDSLARVLGDGAELRFASDQMGYVSWALRHVTGHRNFAWPARGPEDWRRRPGDGFETRYESKARAQGARCVYLSFRRRPR